MNQETTASKECIVRPEGPITAARCEEFRQELQDKVDEGFVEIAVNLEAVDFIDSRGLSVFVVCHKTLSKKKKGKIRVFNASDDLKKLFQIMSLDGQFVVE